jgi:hypothetical protein
VLSIVIDAAVRIARRSLKSPVIRGLAAALFVANFFSAVPFPIIILTAALFGYFGAARGHAAFTAVGHGSAHEDGTFSARARWRARRRQRLHIQRSGSSGSHQHRRQADFGSAEAGNDRRHVSAASVSNRLTACALAAIPITRKNTTA